MVYYTANRTERECAVSRRCDRHPVRRSPALSELLHGRTGRREPRFLPQGARRLRLVAACRRRTPRRIGRTPVSTTRSRTACAPISVTPIATAATGSRRSCCRCGAATMAGPASTSGSRPSRCRRISQLARKSAGLPVPDHTPSSGSTRQFELRSPHAAGRERCRYSRGARVLSPGARRAGLEGRDRTAPSSPPTKSMLNFSSPDQTATLRLSRKYDLTIVNLATQMTQAGAGGAGQGQEGRRRQVHERCRRDGEADDGRGRGQARRAGRQPVGRAVARARRPDHAGAVARRPPRTSSSTAPRANSNSIPPPA